MNGCLCGHFIASKLKSTSSDSFYHFFSDHWSLNPNWLFNLNLFFDNSFIIFVWRKHTTLISSKLGVFLQLLILVTPLTDFLNILHVAKLRNKRRCIKLSSHEYDEFFCPHCIFFSENLDLYISICRSQFHFTHPTIVPFFISGVHIYIYIIAH
jgi:hypothetical protein